MAMVGPARWLLGWEDPPQKKNNSIAWFSLLPRPHTPGSLHMTSDISFFVLLRGPCVCTSLMAAITLHGTSAFGVFCCSPGAAACYVLKVLDRSACSTVVAPRWSRLTSGQPAAGGTDDNNRGRGGGEERSTGLKSAKDICCGGALGPAPDFACPCSDLWCGGGGGAGHEATETGLAYAPVSQAHGHNHIVQCFACCTAA